MIIGIGLGIYVGFFKLFIGGSIQIIEAIKISPICSLDIAWGIGKIFCASFIGFMIFTMFTLIGALFLKDV